MIAKKKINSIRVKEEYKIKKN